MTTASVSSKIRPHTKRFIQNEARRLDIEQASIIDAAAEVWRSLDAPGRAVALRAALVRRQRAAMRERKAKHADQK